MSLTTAELPTIPMDDPVYWQRPAPVLRELRERGRVALTPQGVPALLRWEDGFEAVRGTQFIQGGAEHLLTLGFSEADPLFRWRKEAINTMNGSDHSRVRSLAATALSKSKMDRLRPLIREHAHALLDEWVGNAEIDGNTFALRLPRLVMMDFLGVDRDEMAPPQTANGGSSVIDAFSPFKQPTAEERASANKVIQAQMDHTAALYEKRREEPRDDLLTALVQARNEEGRLSEGELVTLFSSIFGSGSSTGSIIASGLLELARCPEQADLLREEPERWKRGASEEALRYHPAINSVRQHAAADTHAFGLDFAAGDRITVILDAVNRDPSRWHDPEIFDIRRDPGEFSLSFGVGAHLCLGHAMARTTIEEALAVFVQRCTGFGLVDEPRWRPFVMENKLESLRLQVDLR